LSNRVRGDIIGEEIERAATPSIKTGVVPMAGKHAVIDGSPMEGETHMGTPVVYGIENPLIIKNGDGHRPLHHEASLLAQKAHRTDVYFTLSVCHSNTLSVFLVPYVDIAHPIT